MSWSVKAWSKLIHHKTLYGGSKMFWCTLPMYVKFSETSMPSLQTLDTFWAAVPWYWPRKPGVAMTLFSCTMPHVPSSEQSPVTPKIILKEQYVSDLDIKYTAMTLITTRFRIHSIKVSHSRVCGKEAGQIVFMILKSQSSRQIESHWVLYESYGCTLDIGSEHLVMNCIKSLTETDIASNIPCRD